MTGRVAEKQVDDFRAKTQLEAELKVRVHMWKGNIREPLANPKSKLIIAELKHS